MHKYAEIYVFCTLALFYFWATFLEGGCSEVIAAENSFIQMEKNDAVVMLFCDPGYVVAGSNMAFCDGRNWDRNIGKCRETRVGPETWCDFEVHDYCGWTSDPDQDFEWKRRNGYVLSQKVNVGPMHDHTQMKPLAGHYMIAISKEQIPNNAARLISPLYPAEKSLHACFRFYRYMHGYSVGQLRVYIKPRSILMSTMLYEPKYLIYYSTSFFL